MHNGFLCPSHRVWLTANPDFASAHFNRWLTSAQCFRFQQRWQQALPFLGCAYETAELLLKQTHCQSRMLVVQLTTIALLLADTCAKLHRTEEGRQLLHKTQGLLEQQAQQHRELWPICQKCLKTLNEKGLPGNERLQVGRVGGGLD